MFPIYINSENKGLTFQSFKGRMLEICHDHKVQRRALAFALILYDFENPQVSKILGDREYWLALNKISGRFLTIFSLNHQESSGSASANMSFLTEVPTMDSPSEGTNALIEKYFGSNVKVTYPAILFFQVHRDSIVDSLLVELVEEEIEPAFLELKEYIARAVGALRLIVPANRANSREIFDCLEREVESAKKLRKVKRVAGRAGAIIGLVSSIRGLK